MTKTAAEQEFEQLGLFEQRADYIPAEDLLAGTATADLLNRVHDALISRGTKLIVGPRGCGKTHMMRYTWVICQQGQHHPLCVYVSFNRYYRLEPLTNLRTNAIDLFHGWVLARIVLGLYETLDALQTVPSNVLGLLFSRDRYQNLVSRLERSMQLTEEENEVFISLSVDWVRALIEENARAAGRKRAILLLDDAALTLTPEYLVELFEVIRTIKSAVLAPKASVYPGTTEYGPRFHPTQEADIIPVWLSVEDPEYSEVMDAIVARRYPEGKSVPDEVSEYLKFAAFGIPRAYLSMLHQFRIAQGANQQVTLNRIIQEHAAARSAEYASLSVKAPRFKSLIEIGHSLLNKLVILLREQNEKLLDLDEKQLMIGISGLEKSSLSRRMFSLLIEAGLLYEHQSVSHGGPGRTYDRFTPHLALLLEQRAFSAREKGTSLKQIIDKLGQRATKHPLRRTLSTLLSADELPLLRLDLPPCSRCRIPRLNDSQKFCHNCGSELTDVSTFMECMKLALAEVPGLTAWQKSKIELELPLLKTIGDLLSHSDPGTELRKIRQVGQKRATSVIVAVNQYVDEFLS
jgi:ABC-type branched-subunit amino acid transport system ATPase component